MLLSASKSGVKRFIYLSTTDIYENLEEGLIDETSYKCNWIKIGDNLEWRKIALNFSRK